MIEMNKLQFYQHNPLVAKSDYIKWSDRQETDQGQIDPKIGVLSELKNFFLQIRGTGKNVKGKKIQVFFMSPFSPLHYFSTKHAPLDLWPLSGPFQWYHEKDSPLL